MTMEDPTTQAPTVPMPNGNQNNTKSEASYVPVLNHHHNHHNVVLVPPQQVYVPTPATSTATSTTTTNSAMAGLENQFMSLSTMDQHHHGGPTDPTTTTTTTATTTNTFTQDETGQVVVMVGTNDLVGAMNHDPNAEEHEEERDYDDEGDNDEATSDGDPLKLFVGQIPKTLSEEDIFPIFEPFGPLKDLAIIRDKHTGLHRGCAFVTYWSSLDAERAQQILHDQFMFPGGRRPAQVKPAEPSGTVPENKLFIGMLSRKAEEEDVRALFEPYGEIREIYMIRNSDGSSKCAAFLRYLERDSAIAAIENLDHGFAMDGATRPLIVRFADNKHQRQARQMRNHSRRDHGGGVGVMVGMNNNHNHNHNAMYAMPSQPFPGYPMQVPGPMGVPPQYQIPGYPPPGAYGAGAPNQPHHGGPPPPPHHHAYMYHTHHLMGAVGPPVGFRPETAAIRPPNPRPREGPAGANLFVYHLPHDLTDADLATAFNPFGNVVSAKVYVDRNTGESKGFGFVSYDSVISAEAAIEQMNGFQIGNKRLKVQHKRISNSMPPSPQGPVAHAGGGGPPAPSSPLA